MSEESSKKKGLQAPQDQRTVGDLEHLPGHQKEGCQGPEQIRAGAVPRVAVEEKDHHGHSRVPSLTAFSCSWWERVGGKELRRRNITLE